MKINERMDVSISSYLGKLEKGVLVLLSIIYDSKSYEGTYWYTDEYRVLTFESELDEIIGDIQSYSQYDNIMEYLNENTSDYGEIFQTLSEVEL